MSFGIADNPELRSSARENEGYTAYVPEGSVFINSLGQIIPLAVPAQDRLLPDEPDFTEFDREPAIEDFVQWREEEIRRGVTERALKQLGYDLPDPVSLHQARARSHLRS